MAVSALRNVELGRRQAMPELPSTEEAAPMIPPPAVVEALADLFMDLRLDGPTAEGWTYQDTARHYARIILDRWLAGIRTTAHPADASGGREGLDVERVLDEGDAIVRGDERDLSGWVALDDALGQASLRGQQAAFGWLRNRLGLPPYRATPPTPASAEEDRP